MVSLISVLPETLGTSKLDALNAQTVGSHSERGHELIDSDEYDRDRKYGDDVPDISNDRVQDRSNNSLLEDVIKAAARRSEERMDALFATMIAKI